MYFSSSSRSVVSSSSVRSLVRLFSMFCSTQKHTAHHVHATCKMCDMQVRYTMLATVMSDEVHTL